MDHKDKLQAEIEDKLKIKALDFADTLLSYYEVKDDVVDRKSTERAGTVESIAGILSSMVHGVGVIVSMGGADNPSGEMAILGKGTASLHAMLDLALYMRGASLDIIRIIKNSLPNGAARLIDLAIERAESGSVPDDPVSGVDLNGPVADA